MGAVASGAGGGRFAALARWRPYVVVLAAAAVIALVPARQIGKGAERGAAPAAASTAGAAPAAGGTGAPIGVGGWRPPRTVPGWGETNTTKRLVLNVPGTYPHHRELGGGKVLTHFMKSRGLTETSQGADAATAYNQYKP